jgi:flavin reductase (DIM6/NTAB) family NADH-FMN oxidoreductase RutF/rubredoxin
MNTFVFRNISYGLYVLSSMNDGKPTGCIINSVMQITSEPATIAISVNHSNFTNECIKTTQKFSVSILGEKTDSRVIGDFGFRSGRDSDKYKDYKNEFHDDLPIFSDACGYITCKVIDTMETSTHTVFLGKVIGGDILSDDTPMTYAYYHAVLKGKSPKAAPTYIKEESTSGKKTYVCSICGYEYDGDIPFEELPDDYTCPICGHKKEFFVEKQ